jgi:hypothetical protein
MKKNPEEVADVFNGLFLSVAENLSRQHWGNKI